MDYVKLIVRISGDGSSSVCFFGGFREKRENFERRAIKGFDSTFERRRTPLIKTYFAEKLR